MKDTDREALSALMDGEAGELELRRILNSEDESLRAEWSALHRGQQLRKEGVVPFADMDISARVMAAIDEEPAVSGSSWRQTLAGLAVAAGVAAVVVFAGNGQFTGSAAPELASNTMAASPNSGRVYPAQMGAAGTNGGVPVSAQGGAMPTMNESDAEARKRFDELLRKHTERASLNNGQGFVSYARVVSQESE